MKIKIVFVIIAVIFTALGFIGGSTITNKTNEQAFAKIEKIYQTQHQEDRDDFNALAGKARILINQQLYIRKVKNGKVSYDPASTMDIGEIIDNAISKTPELPIDDFAVDSVVIAVKKKTLFEKLKNLFK